MSDEANATGPTNAEKAAWAVFAVAGLIAVGSAMFLGVQLEAYDGEPEVPLAILTAALPLVGLGLVPALILAGIRQLLPRLSVGPRAVHDTDTTADDSHDGREHPAGGEHLTGDVGEPDAGYTRSQR